MSITYKGLNFLNSVCSAKLSRRLLRVFSTETIGNVLKSSQPVESNITITREKYYTDLGQKLVELIGEESANGIKLFLKPRERKKVQYSFVWNNDVASKIVENVLRGQDKENCVILEFNPGFGLITQNLLQSGVPCVHVFNKIFSNKLWDNELFLRCQFHNSEFINSNKVLSDLALSSIHDISVSKKSCKVIGVLANPQFLYSLPHLILTKQMKSTFERTEFYIVLPECVLEALTDLSRARVRFTNFCLLHFTMELEVLDEYACLDFLPVLKGEEQKMFLTKLKLKNNIRDDEVSIFEYIIFLGILGRSKNNLIIPTLEEWVPGCGTYLISKGITITNKTKDLTVDETFTLFKLFTKCDGYENFRLLQKSLIEEEALLPQEE